MTPNQLEVSLYRILSGFIKVHLNNGIYYLRNATPEEKADAAELYEEAIEQGKQCGLLAQSEVISSLIEAGVWPEEKENKFKQSAEDIPKLKMKYFELFNNAFHKDKARELLIGAKKLYSDLYVERGSHDHHSLEYQAVSVKIKYLVGRTLLRSDKRTPVYTGDEFLESEDSLIEEVIAASGKYKPGEAVIRKIARNEPWRSIWACRHSENSVFGVAASNLTDEQRYLAVWSRLYDNSYEDPEHPSEAIYDDNDAFDGWLLMKKTGKKSGDDISDNPAISGAGEVFVIKSRPGEEGTSLSLQDREALYARMTPEAQQAKKARVEAVNQAGALSEANMPDTKARLMRQAQMMGAKFGG